MSWYKKKLVITISYRLDMSFLFLPCINLLQAIQHE